MIDANRLPIVAGEGESRQEYPPGGVHIEAGIVRQPSTDISSGTARDRCQLRYPPAVDLEWTEIVAAVAVPYLRSDPPTFLITQTPQGLFEPPATGGRPSDASRDDPLSGCLLLGCVDLR